MALEWRATLAWWLMMVWKNQMRTMRPASVVVTLILLANVGSASVAFGQAEKSSAAARFSVWTKVQLDAAKKHWAQDQQAFLECSNKLDELKKASRRRMSFHRQGHFLDTCMREKH